MVITMYGKVRGKARPRVTRHGAYTPKETKDYERMIGDAYVFNGGELHDGPVSVTINVYRELPKSRPKKVDFEPDTFKPDIDNIVKIVLDGLNGVAWKDDSQVTMVHAVKHDRKRCEEKLVVSIDKA